MNDKLDNYSKLVDLIGDIIKATSNPNDQKDLDKALDIAHTVGNTLKVIVNKNDNIVLSFSAKYYEIVDILE